MLETLAKNDRVKQITVQKIISLLKEEINKGNLDPNLLKERVREEINI
jgi:hypothetical protein